MQHVQTENVCDAARAKRKLLGVGDGVEPRTPDEVSRKNLWRELLEKTGACADFDRDTAWLSKGEQACEEFIVVDVPQNGFLFPNAAVPKKLLLSLRVDGHGAFFDCTEFGDQGASKARAIVSTGN